MPSQDIVNIPNAVTCLRVVGALPIVVLLLLGSTEALWVALILMLFAEATDGIDGYVARRFDQVSAIGKILDPMADSMYRMAVFMAFVAIHWMPLWMLLVVVGRDILVAYIRVVAEYRVGTLGARSSGKWKAIVQGGAQVTTVAVHALSWEQNAPYLTAIVSLTLWVSTIVTAYSLIDYAFSTFRKVQP